MDEKKLKILQVHNYYQIPGGEDTVVANEKKLLEGHGNTVIQYTRNNGELKDLGKARKLLLPFTTIFNPKTYRDVKRIIKEEHIDIVHVHNTLNLISPAVYYAALKCKVPVVQTVHNFRLICPGATFYRDGHICEDCVEHGLMCAVKHRCYRGSKAQTLICVVNTWIHRKTGIYGKINYICLTEFNKEKLMKLNQIKHGRVFVKPNFVDADDAPVTSYKHGTSQFIFAGRLDKLKGIDILFEAWRLMGADAPKLLVCGTGLLEDWCKEYIKNEYIKENHLTSIEMKGFVPNTEVKKLIANSEALILPTQWYEGFPMTIVEAYSVGTPVITSDLGNAGAVVIDGATGYKFKADSSESLENVVKIFESTQEINWESNVLLEYKNRYSPERNYEMLSSVYDRVKEQVAPENIGGYRTPIVFQFCPDHISTESVAA